VVFVFGPNVALFRLPPSENKIRREYILPDYVTRLQGMVKVQYLLPRCFSDRCGLQPTADDMTDSAGPAMTADDQVH